MNVYIDGIPHVLTPDVIAGICTGTTYYDKRWRLSINFMHRRNQRFIDELTAYENYLENNYENNE